MVETTDLENYANETEKLNTNLSGVNVRLERMLDLLEKMPSNVTRGLEGELQKIRKEYGKTGDEAEKAGDRISA